MKKDRVSATICLIICVFLLSSCSSVDESFRQAATKISEEPAAQETEILSAMTSTTEPPTAIVTRTSAPTVTLTPTTVQTDTPRATRKPSPTRTPKPTPVPPQVEGWNTTPINVVCLEVEQEFAGCQEIPRDIEEKISHDLPNYLGIQTGSPCDATLTVNISTKAILGWYELGRDRYECYAKCEVNAQAVLTAPGLTTLSADLSETTDAPKSMPRCAEDPCERDAYDYCFGGNSPLDDLLASLWGISENDYRFDRHGMR